jgi:3D (Asp-Asp-Asp) domain-containing protein
MKKFITYLVIASAGAYYAVLPFVIAKAANADSTPAIPAATSGIVLPNMRVTAYASVPDETDSTPFITANGTYVHDGVAASNILPFGTKIEIPAVFGDKIFTIEDRTSPKFKGTIDLWMPSVAKAITFGVAHAAIVVLSVGTTTPQLAITK